MKYYGVRKGRIPGVYTTWDIAKEQVDGFKGAQFKSFSSKKEAEEYIDMTTYTITSNTEARCINAWTDGACSNNGSDDARAGIGVFFGDSDPRNLSERFVLSRPTNQRAEIYAVIRLLEIEPEGNIMVHTDSMYCINAMTDWIHSWLKNNWKNNTVTNRDLFERLYNLISNRRGTVKFKHVNGHQGIHGNEMADRLAVAGTHM